MIRTYDEIYNDLKNSFLRNQDKITDMSKAGIMRAFLVAVATEEARKYIETEMSFTESMKKIPPSIFGFKKKQGTFASGTVRFSTNETNGVPFECIIPKGTRVSGAGHTYLTEGVAKINQGDIVSNDVIAKAEKVGEAQNVEVGVISGIETIVPDYVKEVTNAGRFTGGSNQETDTEYLLRFNDYINGLQGTSYYGLKSACLGVNGVKSVSIVENYDTNNIYAATIFAEDGSGKLSAATKAEIETVINGDGTPQNPGKRSPGINIQVMEPVSIDLNVAITCEYENAEADIVRQSVENVVRTYINSLGIGQDVVMSDIIREVRTYSYVKDTYVTQLTTGELLEEEELDVLPPKKIQIAQHQIARFNSCNISLVSVGELA